MLVEGEDLIAITPTSMDYFGIHVEDICIVDFEGNLLEGKFKPSIETAMHIEVYSTALILTPSCIPTRFMLVYMP